MEALQGWGADMEDWKMSRIWYGWWNSQRINKHLYRKQKEGAERVMTTFKPEYIYRGRIITLWLFPKKKCCFKKWEKKI